MTPFNENWLDRLEESDLEDEPMPSWLFVCSCGFKFTVEAAGGEQTCPIRACSNCGRDVKGGF